MKKQTKILIVIVALLIVSVGIFAWLNAGDLEQKKQLEADAEFLVQVGEEEYIVTMQDMLSLEPETITAIKDTSYTGPEEVEYTGVEFKTICEELDIDLSTASDVEFKALDGYSSAVTIDDVLDDDSIYIVIEMEGEALGTKSDGGDGPYMMITAKTQFSQSWCKFLEVAIVR